MTEQTTTATLPELFGEKFHAEIAKRADKGLTGRECAVCGRSCGAKPVPHARLSSSTGLALPADAEGADDDQGCFPVGRTCAKAFPAGYLTEPMVAERIDC